MASRKNDPNSSKTAHVMNLLSRGRGSSSAAPPQNPPPEAPAAPAAPAPTPAAPPQPQPAPMAPHASQSPAREAPARSAPVISIVNADASAANAIKDALESALLDAEKAEMPVPPGPEPVAEEPAPLEPEPVVQEPAPPEPEPVAQEPAPSEPEPVAQEPAPPEPEPVAQEPVPSEPEPVVEEPAPPEPEPVAQEPAPFEPDYASYNIMELLVEEAVDRYIRMFGLCDCPRCRADVVAEALTNLIPKYVVMGKAESNPRLAIYRSQYSAAVTAQILRACKVVMDDPRH